MIRWPLSNFLQSILPLYLAYLLSFLCGCTITLIISYLKNLVPLYNSPVLDEYLYKDVYGLIDYLFKNLIYVPVIDTYLSVKNSKIQ